MDHGKKSIDCIHPGEPVMTERHDRDQCSGVRIRLEYLDTPFATDINEMMEAVSVGNSDPAGQRRRWGRVLQCRGFLLQEYHRWVDPRIPEDAGLWCWQSRIGCEIATSIF